MLKPEHYPMVSLSRSERGDFSPGEDRRAEAFERLLLEGPPSQHLQDRMMKAVTWCEGRTMTEAAVTQVRTTARRVLLDFLEEGRLPTLMLRAEELSRALNVSFDAEDRRLNIELPAEVRQCLLQAPSMISY